MTAGHWRCRAAAALGACVVAGCAQPVPVGFPRAEVDPPPTACAGSVLASRDTLVAAVYATTAYDRPASPVVRTFRDDVLRAILAAYVPPSRVAVPMIDSAAFYAEAVRGMAREGPLFDGELLIVFDPAGRVRDTRIVESPDTPDLMPALIAAVNQADAAHSFPPLPPEVGRTTTPVRIRLFGTRSTLPPPTDSAASVITIAEPRLVVSLADVAALPIAGYGAPRYPAGLKSNWITGEVTLQFIVDATGRAVARSARTVYTSHPDFATSTREALPQMRFQPALVGKCPVASWVRQKFEFRLGSTPPPPGAVRPPDMVRSIRPV